MNTKILITGGAGFIGSHIADYFVDLKYNVIVVDDLSTGNIENVQSKKIDFHELDIGKKHAKKGLIHLLKDVDYVFHLAAIPRMQYCVENPEKCNQTNVNGTLNLLDACKENKIKKIILSSSCGIYGVGHDKHAIKETSKLNMSTPYVVQKYIQELYVKLYTDLYDVPSVVLRYFNVYGTRRQTEKGSYPNVLAAFSKQQRKYNKVFVTDTGKQNRDMVYISDVVDVNIKAMKSKFKNGEVFNIGTGKTITINKIATYFDCPIEHIKPRSGEPFQLKADTTKSRKLLKWQAKISFEKGIKRYFES